MTDAVHSFDVFDTVLTRVWARPEDVFRVLGARLRDAGLSSQEDETFRRLRQEAETAARQEVPGGEPTLAEIHQTLATAMTWTESQTTTAAEMEIAVEDEALVAVPGQAETLRRLRAGGAAIVFLSDMYLPSETIRGFLEKRGLWPEGARIWVSCEHSESKHGGGLFRRFLADTGSDPSRVTHRGDNALADVAMPRRHGLASLSFADCHLTRHEKRLAGRGDSPTWRIGSLLAGASRLARLAQPAATDHGRVIRDTAAAVAGPLLTGFTAWCLRTARESGVRRLYFLSRDGQIPLRIAQRLNTAWGFPIECRYLHASRHAWHIPAIHALDRSDLDLIFERTNHFTARVVCGRADQQPAAFRDALAAIGLPESEWDTPLDETTAARLRSLFQEPAVRERVLAATAVERERALGYLRQEGLFDGTPFAVVDVGWKGSLQRSLARLLTLGGGLPPGGLTGLYFGLHARIKDAAAGTMRAWYVDGEATPPARPPSINRALIELLFSADHGSVTGYRPAPDGRHEPVLRRPDNPEAAAWGVPLLHETVLRFAELAAERLSPDDLAGPVARDRAQAVLDLLTDDPGPEEARVFGAFRFAEDQTEQSFYPLAPRIGLREALHEFWHDRPPLAGCWHAASLKLLSPTLRPLYSPWLRVQKCRVISLLRRLGGRPTGVKPPHASPAKPSRPA